MKQSIWISLHSSLRYSFILGQAILLYDGVLFQLQEIRNIRMSSGSPEFAKCAEVLERDDLVQ